MRKVSRLKRLWIWLSRCSHSRGFGVQSPWAYSFIRYVVSEHYPYYAYDELRQRYAEADAVTRKLAEFYFRLANFRQPEVVACYGATSPLYAAYMKRGCRKLRTVGVGSGSSVAAWRSRLLGLGRVDLLLLCADDGADAFVEALLPLADERLVLVVEEIGESARARQLWQRIIDSDVAGVSFDLYYCGVVFFDRKMYKQQYVVNF